MKAKSLLQVQGFKFTGLNDVSTSELPVHGAQMRAPTFFIVLIRDFELRPFLGPSAVKKKKAYFLVVYFLFEEQI